MHFSTITNPGGQVAFCYRTLGHFSRVKGWIPFFAKQKQGEFHRACILDLLATVVKRCFFKSENSFEQKNISLSNGWLVNFMESYETHG